jgi:uncharacterized phage protein (TIGR02216 family)
MYARIGMGVLGIAPDTFWRITPMDFWLTYDGYLRKQGKAPAPKVTMQEYLQLRESLRAKGLDV